MSFGFLLGLGVVGCKEHNPAFHKPADGGASVSSDTAVDSPVSPDAPADVPVNLKDAEPRADTTEGPKDAKVDRKPEKEGGASEPTDTLGVDVRVEAGSADTTLARDAKLDGSLPDGPSFEVSPVDAEPTDAPTPVQDTAALSAVDGNEGDAFDDVLPDAEGPATFVDAEISQPDSL